MLVIWQDFDPRVFVFFGFALFLSEVFVGLRWRTSVSCVRCGFDPVVYKRSPEEAARRVRRYLEERADDPVAVLKGPPPGVREQVRAKKHAARAKTSGSRLNARV